VHAGVRSSGSNPHIHADADFCIHGSVGARETKPEGPFGDHLGYYAKAHDFPVLRVDRVTHRADAIWPFTTVGRPPQEDTIFGELIHEMTGPLVPSVLPGVRKVHAVDASGVHPLLLAIGSERYTPYAESQRPMELLTQAHAILGQGQMSLAKYLFIANGNDAPALDLHDIRAFFTHMLERIDFSRDLHFTTKTTMDTLDYSGDGLNEGSKLVVAAVGAPRRELATLRREQVSSMRLPEGFGAPHSPMPGVLVVSAPAFRGGATPVPNQRKAAAPHRAPDENAARFAEQCGHMAGFPLVVLTEDSGFAAQSLANFLWVTFTRSNPAVDVHGFAAKTEFKHWSCDAPLVIDARKKPHHAPSLEEDPETTRRVDALFAKGGALGGLSR
jgi:4-hydroxy-3-polyprenylbenzoate decarboxylase